MIKYDENEHSLAKTCVWLFAVTLLTCAPEAIRAQGTITVDSYMEIFTAELGSSDTDSYMVYGSGFPVDSPPVNIIITGSSAFLISTSSSSGYGTSIQITEIFDGYFEAMIWVKFEPASKGSHTAEIDHTSDAAPTQSLTVDGNATILPVSLVSLRAKTEDERMVLEWITASEKNNFYFDVEMKTGDGDFVRIGRVASKVGTSTTPTNYRFEQVTDNFQYMRYFRLKQVDLDQAFSYSQVVSLPGNTQESLALRVVTDPAPQLEVATRRAGYLTVKILTLNGRLISNMSSQLSDGSTVRIGLGDLTSPGKYLMAAEFRGEPTGQVQQQRMIIMVN